MLIYKPIISNFKDYISKTWIYRYYQLLVNFNSNLKRNLISQLRFKNSDSIISKPASSHKIIIPLIETNHYQYYQMLALVKALTLRGCEVLILLCGSTLKGCEIKSVRSSKIDPCLECRFNAKNVVPYFNMQTRELNDFLAPEDTREIKSIAQTLSKNYPEKFLYKGIDIIPTVNDSVTRFFYGAVPEEGSKPLQIQRQYHIETAMTGLVVCSKIFSEWKPSALLGSMNVYTAWEPYYMLADLHGVKTHLISRSPFNYNGLVYNQMDLYYSKERFEKWKSLKSSSRLSDIEEKELDEYIRTRFSGNDQLFKDTNMFSETTQKLSEILKINPDKRNIFLFSNIFWDIGMNKLGALYDAVVPWVLDTIDLLKDELNCHLYIKIHPIELFDSGRSLKGVADFINERFPDLADNITIITPDLKIKTYDLFPFIDLGVVYNGTIGIEMMLNNIPVVITGTAPYNHIDSVNVPDTREKYHELLINSSKVAHHNINEIRMFAYFYFIKSLIPWDLTFRAYADDFKKYKFDSLEELMPGRNKYLDHLCNCIMFPDSTIVENW